MKLLEGISDIDGTREKVLDIFKQNIKKYFPNGKFNVEYTGKDGKKYIVEIFISTRVSQSRYIEGSWYGNDKIYVGSKFRNELEVLATLAHELVHLGQRWNGALNYSRYILSTINKDRKAKGQIRVTKKNLPYYKHSEKQTEKEAVIIAILTLIKDNHFNLAAKNTWNGKNYFDKITKQQFLRNCYLMKISNEQLNQYRKQVAKVFDEKINREQNNYNIFNVNKIINLLNIDLSLF